MLKSLYNKVSNMRVALKIISNNVIFIISRYYIVCHSISYRLYIHCLVPTVYVYASCCHIFGCFVFCTLLNKLSVLVFASTSHSWQPFIMLYRHVFPLSFVITLNRIVGIKGVLSNFPVWLHYLMQFMIGYY